MVIYNYELIKIVMLCFIIIIFINSGNTKIIDVIICIAIIIIIINKYFIVMNSIATIFSKRSD